MDTFSAGELPYTFDRIEFGAIRRQKVELEVRRMPFSPGLVKPSVVVFGIVHNHHDATAGSAGSSSQALEEFQVGLSIEFPILTLPNQFSVAQSDGTKVAHALAAGVVQDHRIGNFWRNPHTTARTTLLKVNFVSGPQIYGRIAAQGLQFFLCCFCSPASACARAGRGLRSRNPNCRNNR